jgi:hypothetical protein
MWLLWYLLALVYLAGALPLHIWRLDQLGMVTRTQLEVKGDNEFHYKGFQQQLYNVYNV